MRKKITSPQTDPTRFHCPRYHRPWSDRRARKTTQMATSSLATQWGTIYQQEQQEVGQRDCILPVMYVVFPGRRRWSEFSSTDRYLFSLSLLLFTTSTPGHLYKNGITYVWTICYAYCLRLHIMGWGIHSTYYRRSVAKLQQINNTRCKVLPPPQALWN